MGASARQKSQKVNARKTSWLLEMGETPMQIRVPLDFKKAAISLAAVAIACTMETPAVAQSDAAASIMDNIIVTARKREESLFETPVAVTVISDEFLEVTGFNTVNDLVRFVPGFDLTPINTSRATGSKIRGISTFSFSDGFESSVATVIDGVVLGREAQGFFDFFDVETIEIIKGPQGTLFGKNASAGVINIRTKDPEFEFGAGGDISYGRYNEFKIRGSVTGPLVGNKLAARLSGTFNRRDGVLDNVLPGEDDLNDKSTYSLRGKILYQPTADLTVKFTGDFVEEDNRCCQPTFRNAGPPNLAVGFALNSGVLQIGDALSAVGIVPGPRNRSVAVLDENILQDSQAGGAALDVEYDFGAATLKSITSYRAWEINEFNEADGVSNSNANNRNGTVSSTKQFSQELRLDGSFLDRVSYVAGLYYFHQDLDAQGQVDVELALPFAIPGLGNLNSRTNADRAVENDSFAVFTETTIDITDKLSLILGGRFTHEEIEAWYNRVGTPINPLLPFSGSNFGPDVTGFQKVEDDNLSGRFIGRYFWTDDLMTYASWSRGYKGPGIDVAESVNVAAITTPGGLPVLAPEVPTLIEAGFRSQLFEGQVSTNVTFFHQNVRDLQTITSDSLGNVLNLSIDKLNTMGIEADLVFAPNFIDGLTITGGFTWNEVDIVEFSDNVALEGSRFRDSPRYFYSLIGNYQKPILNTNFTGFLQGEWAWQSSKNTTLGQDDFAVVDSYGLLNLRVGIDSPDQRYGVIFAVENALDKDYEHFIFGSSYGVLDGNATNAQFIGDPITWSLTLRAQL